ncbi:MAG: DNA topoisomerase IB [Pseudomonadota bacterium]
MNLVYYPDDRPGIRRRRCGRGFTYLSPDGGRIGDERERARIVALAVPPAYEDVWICPLPEGHLRATGRDDRGRKQYRYHPDWTKARAEKKYDGLAAFGRTLPRLRRWIAERLAGEPDETETAVAAALALIDRASLRIGDPAYTEANGSFGALTLRARHARFEGDDVILDYPAKGGRRVRKRLRGARLQRALHRSADLPGRELIAWRGTDGAARAVRSEQVRETLESLCGDGVTAKTMRTWNGTHAAFLVAAADGAPTIAAMAEAAAERLHNSPAIARESYIHPRVIELAEAPPELSRERLSALSPTAPEAGFRSGERELLALLD